MREGNGRQGGGRDEQQGRDNRRDEGRGHDAPTTKTKAVYALTERGERTYWTRVGIAFVNKDQSLTLRLEALPVSGTLQVRDDEPRDDGERR